MHHPGKGENGKSQETAGGGGQRPSDARSAGETRDTTRRRR